MEVFGYLLFGAVETRAHALAELTGHAGIEYCGEHDLDGLRPFLIAMRGEAELDQGDVGTRPPSPRPSRRPRRWSRHRQRARDPWAHPSAAGGPIVSGPRSTTRSTWQSDRDS